MSADFFRHLSSIGSLTSSRSGQELSPKQARLLQALVRAGATGPERARQLGEFPPVPLADVSDLVDRGVLREAIDGKFYVFQRGPMDASPTRGALKTLAFWLIVVVVGLVLWFVV